MKHKNEIFIINSLKSGDKKIFERLYSDYYQKLCAFLLNYCQNRAIIEDVVQDVFLNLWMKRKDIHIKTSLNAFLYRAAYNRLMDKYRHLRLKNDMLSSYYHTAVILAADVDSETSKKKMKLLENCMEELPERCKEVFYASKIQGLNYKELSERFQISLKTVEGHISRAYRILKECMQL
ncbi:MAG: RNA polymerase sigma-70 factor [Muricauda sp.]|nr:RNA polymerase sigma-70 factor [Allomuricauda sp.]MBA4744115.1 RNA polymerase sigma-70 factor [Allomuricauda sp.]